MASLFIREFEKTLTSRLKERLNFIQVVLGPRQVGKTTAVRRIFEAWSGPKKFVAADSPSPPNSSWLLAHWEEAAALGPGSLLVIDEVQKIQGWSEIIKPLFDRNRSLRKMNVVLLGSASLSIGAGLSESLAGRFEIIRAPHWSLKECAEAFNVTLPEYLQFGGYPAALELRHDIDRWRSFLRDSIIEPVLGRDILSTARVAKPALFRQTFELAMSFPAQVISYTKLLGQLQEKGNVETIKHYLSLFEGAFLLKQVHRFSKGIVMQKTSSPKLVPLDSSLIAASTPPFRYEQDLAWRGRLLEAAFGAHLVRQGGELFYWSQGRVDVDFVHVVNGQITAYEVKSGRERDARGLAAFKNKYPEAAIRLVDADDITRILTS